MGILDPPEMGPRAQFCDLCYRGVAHEHGFYTWIEGRVVCDHCSERFAAEETAVNKTIRLVPRGFYAEGRKDPGPNPT